MYEWINDLCIEWADWSYEWTVYVPIGLHYLFSVFQQAVLFQKKMNEIYKGEKTASLPPIQVAPPSLSGVLELLNIINGILFVHVSQKELDSLRTEIRQQQQQQQSTSAGAQQQQQQAIAAPALASTVVPGGQAKQHQPSSDKASSQNKSDDSNNSNLRSGDAASKERRSSDEMDEGLGSGDEIVEGVLQQQQPQQQILTMNEEDVD